MHGAKEADGAVDIDAVVLQGNFAGFTYRLEGKGQVRIAGVKEKTRIIYFQGSKVDDAVDVWVSIEDFVKFLLICNVEFVELRPFATDELNAIEDLVR